MKSINKVAVLGAGTMGARIAAQLQHPAIVPVYELGISADQRPFFTMKLVEGQTLADLLKLRADANRDLPRWLGIDAATVNYKFGDPDGPHLIGHPSIGSRTAIFLRYGSPRSMLIWSMPSTTP